MVQEIMPMDSINYHAKENRQVEYRKVADPLFFKAQRGDATMEEWQNTVAAIKAKYPYVTEDQVIEVTYPEES